MPNLNTSMGHAGVRLMGHVISIGERYTILMQAQTASPLSTHKAMLTSGWSSAARPTGGQAQHAHYEHIHGACEHWADESYHVCW